MRHSKARYTARRADGFSLVELSCAFAILSAGVFGAIQAYNVAFNFSRAEREYAVAHRALVNELEMRRAQPFDRLATGTDQRFLTRAPELSGLHAAAASVEVSPAQVAGLVQVTARVKWIGDKGRAIAREVTTLLADRGVAP